MVAFNDLLVSYSFLHAWSNWVLEAFLFILILIALKIDVKQKMISPMTSGFIALLAINFAASIAHGIEHIDRFKLLANDISYINFGLLGFASLFFEFFVLQRIKILKSIGCSGFNRFPFRLMTLLVFFIFVVFQIANWAARKEPKYEYAVMDYGASLLIMAGVSLYALKKLNFDIKKSGDKQVFFSSRFEVHTLLSIVTAIIATASLQSHLLYNALNLQKYQFFNLVDIYHLLLLPSFAFLLKARIYQHHSISLGAHR